MWPLWLAVQRQAQWHFQLPKQGRYTYYLNHAELESRELQLEQNPSWVRNNRYVERLCSLPRSQQSDAGPFPKPHESSSYSNIYPTRFNVTQFILSENCSTCFGWYHHPSAGAQTTVSTASGICHTVEQFPDKINCVTLHLVGYILEYYYDARTHER